MASRQIIAILVNEAIVDGNSLLVHGISWAADGLFH
jgi:hypothetical protein